MAEKIQRDALGAKQGPGIAGNCHQLGATGSRLAVAGMRRNGGLRVEVMSPARPRSSSSARVTAASISSGERKASARFSDVANLEVAKGDVEASGMARNP